MCDTCDHTYSYNQDVEEDSEQHNVFLFRWGTRGCCCLNHSRCHTQIAVVLLLSAGELGLGSLESAILCRCLDKGMEMQKLKSFSCK